MSGVNRIIKTELATSGKHTEAQVKSAFSAANIRSEMGNKIDKGEYKSKKK